MGLLEHIKKLDVKVLQLIDVSETKWCNEAALLCVKNGKGTLTHQASVGDDEYYCSQLLLNEKPIIQGRYSKCPTCAGMLAAGYGIENIKSQELEKVRECMNSEYKGIMESVEDIKPLLGLLNDGYYILADVKLYPSDGQGRFFYSVPNELTYNEATCGMYFDYENFCSGDVFPAFFYPTQSSELINEERVEEYIRKMELDSNRYRGLAYYETGFMCALLDGHHKACAASTLGTTLNCLTIIPFDRLYWHHTVVDGVKKSEMSFLGIKIGLEHLENINNSMKRKNVEKYIPIPLYNLTGRELPNHYINRYPTVETIVRINNDEFDIETDPIEYARILINAKNVESAFKLKCLMKYLYECSKEESYSVAKMILDEEDEYYFKDVQECAIKEMLSYQNEEAEQYMINYLANHNSTDQWWELVSSYWK